MTDLSKVLDIEKALELLSYEAYEKVGQFKKFANDLGTKELDKILHSAGHDPAAATEVIYRIYTKEEDPNKSFAVNDKGDNWIKDILNQGEK